MRKGGKYTMIEVKKQLKGIGVSDGIGLGKAYFLEMPKKFDESEMVSLDDEEKEMEKVTEAVNRMNRRYEKKIEKMRQEHKVKQEDYISMHQSILNDNIFQESIMEYIEQEHSAVSAISLAMKKQIAFIKKMDNALIQRCIPEIEDVAKRLLYEISGYKYPDLSTLTEDIVLFGEEIPSSVMVEANYEHIKGIITVRGGSTSHMAIMVRNMEIPAVVACEGLLETVKMGEMLFVDGKKGILLHDLTEDDIEKAIKKILEFAHEKQILKQYTKKQTITTDGKKMRVFTNIFDVQSKERLKKIGAEGIGLFRTDFLYTKKTTPPTEEEQFEIYKTAVKQVGENPIVIRTLDIGGDKKVDFLDTEKEMNPFLGFRAIRICLQKPHIFITQLKAILRAAVYGNVSIMLPMISNMQEVEQSLEIIQKAKEELAKEGKKFKQCVKIGIMIEVPSAAIMAESLIKKVDFFSLGTNDLTQYILAADRMNAQVACKYSHFEPSVLRLVHFVVQITLKAGKYCYICGEMASDLKSIPFLIGIGVTTFSVTPPTVLKTRKAICEIDSREAHQLAKDVLKAESLKEVLKLL